MGQGTRLELTGDISPEGIAGAAVLGPLATLAFKRGMRQNLAALKRTLESTARGS